MSSTVGLGDLTVVRDRLTSYFSTKYPEATEVTISDLSMPSNGYSNETAVFDASWTQEGSPRAGSFVLRSQVPGRELFFETDLSLQWKMMEGFATNPGVPVPGLIVFEEDPSVLGMPFFVMTKAEGRVPLNGTPSYHATGWVYDLPEEAQRRLYRNTLQVWVNIHDADWERDFAFLNRTEHGEPGIDQQIGYIEASYDWARLGRTFSVIERGLEYAKSNKPDNHDVSVCWGDCRVGNVVFGPDQSVQAVLDWEMATLGPRELEVAWWMMFERLFGNLMAPNPLPGIGSADEVPELYEELSGYTPRNLDYFETFAWLRLAVCMIRMEAPNADDDAEAFMAKDPVMGGLAARLG